VGIGQLAILAHFLHDLPRLLLVSLVIWILFNLGYVSVNRGRRVAIRGRRHLSPVIVSPEELHNSPFILYLRSFEDDALRQKIQWAGYGDPGDLITHLGFSGLTQEEQIAATLLPNRVVVLGRPGEMLPHAGASRMYSSDNAWQKTVLDLLPRARLVVMAVGLGPNLVWELVQAVFTMPPARLILIVFMSPAEYAEFRETVGSEFRATARRLRRSGRRGWSGPVLPAGPPQEQARSSEAWMIRFGPGWKAEPVALELFQPPRFNNRKEFQESLKRALQPVFEAIK
jgi:hypothetical protein